MMLENKLMSILATHHSLSRDLEIVKSLNLPHWCIAAGYVRNFVWDFLHNQNKSTPLNDVDVLYYDLLDESETTEKYYERILKDKVPQYNWSIKNQARMHIRNNDKRYESVEEAMMRWPETATAIGITLDQDNKLKIIAPYGLNDLFELKIRKSPLFKEHEYFRTRVSNKNWLKTWPKLELLGGSIASCLPDV
ncbi:MAG: nucleotidyltransferase family protein [Candidatus Cohnella colombiensis]|uniref:Nucleotidyltransferase family protein n=1 Tax=Candidatus Cohnella colombiensis TaxID=3121368 RepID=A0AA95F362_9BACL|nr:MAG: nucleotidyltransferase family protein [Cohnella sp.]